MIFLMRRLGRNATTLPGKTALWMDRDLPSYLTRHQNVTLITGTNGKTTATRMLCSIYQASGFRVITNVSGANLISGIVTALIEGLSFSDISNSAKNKVNTGSDRTGKACERKPVRIVLEIDEGAFGRYAASLHPAVIAVTNLFRDQLDRYGELSKTRACLLHGIQESKEARVLLCADDSLCASLAGELSASLADKGREGESRVKFCGMEKDSMQENRANRSAATEAGNCVFCGGDLSVFSPVLRPSGVLSLPGLRIFKA